MFKKLAFFCLIFFILFTITPVINGAEFDLSAKSALLMEVKSGEVIFEKNPELKLPPASMTKIMTMLLVMEAIEDNTVSLTDKIIISERAASMGGSQVYLEAGEEMNLEELMKAVAISSANDASVAVAEYVYGTEDRFVQKMNERAKELGLKNTYYYNTNGLPSSDAEIEGNYTTVYDLARLTREIYKYEKIFKWASIWIDSLRRGEFVLNNTNRLVKHFQGANGLKTGHTDEAGFCITATARRGDLDFIAVIMGAESSDKRFTEAAKLLNYGFNLFESREIAIKGEKITAIDIINAKPARVDLIADSKLVIPMKKGEKTTIKQKVYLEDNIKAPLEAGERVGELRIYKENLLLAKTDLLLAEKVDKIIFYKLWYRKLKLLIMGIFKNIF
ncbi:MAG: serine hydrolase [Halanaerobiales bacterium]